MNGRGPNVCGMCRTFGMEYEWNCHSLISSDLTFPRK